MNENSSAQLPHDQQATSAQETTLVNKRSRRAQIIIASITAGVMLLTAGVAALTWPSFETGAAAELPTTGYDEWLDEDDFNAQSSSYEWEREMNEALESGDKDAFLANSEGQAQEMLGYWWDGTRDIGWEYAYAVGFPGFDEEPGYLELGMKLGFASHPLRSSGSNDAGLDLTQMFQYEAVFEGEGNDAVLVELIPNTPMPWDEGPIYVAKRDQVVLFGVESERALVDANIDLAQESAATALELLQRIGGEAPTDGFTAAITDDAARFDAWGGGHEELDDMEVAGFAQSTRRPSIRTEYMPQEIATGNYSSGSWVAIGPLSESYRGSVFIHEFAHVLHESALPYNSLGYTSMQPTEGFAEYLEHLASQENGYSVEPRVQQAIAEHGEGAFSAKLLRGEDAYWAYQAAASFFHYIEAAGGSPWQLAMDRDNGLTMEQRAKHQNPEFTEEAWQAWAAQL